MSKTLEYLKRKLSWSGLSLLIIAVAMIWSMFNIKLWNVGEKCTRAVINQDVTNFYSYLPAAFIYRDLTFNFAVEEGTSFGADCEIWPVPVEGKEDAFVIKTSMGLSYLYMPFFLMAHGYTTAFSDYPADGFSRPYEFFLVLSSVFYLILGAFFLRKLLLRYFKDGVVAVVLLLTVFATNLYYYGSTEPAMSHAYSFSLFAIFAYLSVLWIEKDNWKYALGIGLIGGLITLIRPANILVFIIPALYSISKKEDVSERLKFLFRNYWHLIIVAGSAFIVILPQLLFWKVNSGDWVYYSYTDEHFFFGNPHILDGMFSYRKGWLVYTPIMTFALIGMIISYFKKREFFWSLIIYLPVHLYVIFSWWCWWYGGSFGSRPMIETYALLAFPLAVWVDWIRRHWAGVVSFSIIAILLTSLNLFQTARYRYGSIHYHGMTKEAYWINFWDRDPVPGYWELIKEPDYDKAKKGIDT